MLVKIACCNMHIIIVIATILQVVGTAILTLFSFKGFVVTENPTVFINGKPSTHVTFNKFWLIPSRIGLIFLLVGIAMSGVASLVGTV